MTERLEIMVAVRPTFHAPGPFAKQAANLDHISGGRLSLNVVSSWWAIEARRYGVSFDRHDDRYARTEEWLAIVNGMWTEEEFSYSSDYFQVDGAILEPKPDTEATTDGVRWRGIARRKGVNLTDLRRIAHAR